jgi:hypothetical protein
VASPVAVAALLELSAGEPVSVQRLLECFTRAVNVPAWRTGAGLIVAADRATREVSPRRWVVSPRLLEARYGISERVDGYARARACANPTRR